jgi:hypothetical protein
LVAGFDLSANSTDNNALLYITLPSAVTVDFDAFMLEEYDGSHLTPSAWYKPGGNTDVDGRSILPNTITDATPFASSMVIPTIVSTLPTVGNYIGRIVFLTTDEHVYKYMSTGWKDTGDATQIVGQLVAGQIQAGAIGADQIAANSITTDKLTITGSNVIANSAFSSGNTVNWMTGSVPSAQSIYAPIGGPAKYCMRFLYSGAAASPSIWSAAKAYSAAGADEDGFEVVGLQQYQVNIHAVRSADYASGGLRVFAYFWKADGTYTTNLLAINQATVATTWTDYAGTFTVPANALRCWMYVQSLNQTAGALYWTNLRVHRRMSSELIVDGSIIADKMAANSITATNGAIEDLAVTNAKIADLSASKLTAGTINASTITVTNLNASNLTVGTINGSRYGDDTIDGRPISPGAIHRTVAQIDSYKNAPYYATLATIGPSGANAWIGPITIPANSYRTAVLLLAVFNDQSQQVSPCEVVIGITRGSQSDSGLLGETRFWTKYPGLYMPSNHSYLDTAAGTGSVSYYLGVHQTTSSLGTIPCYLSLIALELSK